MGSLYYLFHLSIFGFIRGVCSALKLQFQKASNTSHENWKRKLKYYRILGYDSRLHGRNTVEYLRAQNVIYRSIVTVMQSETSLLNWESPVGMLNWRALFSSLSVICQPLSFWLGLPQVCPVLFGWKLLWAVAAFFPRMWATFSKTTLPSEFYQLLLKILNVIW